MICTTRPQSVPAGAILILAFVEPAPLEHFSDPSAYCKSPVSTAKICTVKLKEPQMSASALNSKSVIFTMRMPLEHREKLIEAAKKDNRSLANFLVEAGLVLAGRKIQPQRPERVELAA